MLKTSMLCVSVVGLIVGCASKSAPDVGAGETSALAIHLTSLSRTINARLPEMVDTRVRLDATIGGPGPVFSYVYTLPAYRAAEISGAGVYSAYVTSLRHSFCGGADMQSFADAGILLLYIYRGRDGGEITRIFVSASDCLGLDAAPVVFSA